MATAKKTSAPLSIDRRNKLAEGDFAFPKQRKEPLNNASHVRNAIARFDQVKEVSPAEKTAAFKRIRAAAKKFGVDMAETSAADLGKKSPARKSAKKAAKTPAKKVPKS